MKRKQIMALAITIVIALTLTLAVFAGGAITDSEQSFTEPELSPTALYTCPTDSSHRGYHYNVGNATGHNILCNVCDAVIVSEEPHYFIYDEPTSYYAVNCFDCGYVAIPMTSHDIYPDPASGECVAITDELHGLICNTSGCYYNPYTTGYHDIQDYIIPNYESYYREHIMHLWDYETYLHSTKGTWYHKEHNRCTGCDYVVSTWYPCKYNLEECGGTCKYHP